MISSNTGKTFLHRTGLVHMGKHSLGSYVFHMMLVAGGPYAAYSDGLTDAFRVADTAIVPGLRDFMQRGFEYFGWLGVLLSFYTYIAVFMLTLGPAFQESFMFCFELAEHVW